MQSSSREDSVVLHDHEPYEALLDETLSMDMGNLALSQAVTTDDDDSDRQSFSSEDEDEDEYEDANDEFDLGQIDDNDWFSSTVVR